MRWGNRKLRLGIVLAIAITAAFVAWRTDQAKQPHAKCEPGRVEEKDASGAVTKITRTTCG
ncbi:hypothetical protein ACG3SL_07250 [Sphingomonas sp. CJ20]